MFRRAKVVRSRASLAGRFVPAAIIALGLTLITTLTIDSAHAYLMTNDANGSAGIAQAAERTAAATSGVAVAAFADKLPLRGGYCCNRGSDRDGVDCAGGYCGTCLSAIGIVESTLLHNSSVQHPFPIRSRAAATMPPPDLPPPRTLS